MGKPSRRFPLNWIAGWVGVRGGLPPRPQVGAHMWMGAVGPPQTTSTVKQQVVPNGTLASAETQISPSQPGGRGLGAGVLSLLTSLTVKPVQLDGTLIVTVEVPLHPVITWMYEFP